MILQNPTEEAIKCFMVVGFMWLYIYVVMWKSRNDIYWIVKCQNSMSVMCVGLNGSIIYAIDSLT